MVKKLMLRIQKIFALFFIIKFLLTNFAFSANSDSNFYEWLSSYKKFALKKGISQETLDVAFKDVKFCCDTAFKYYENFPYWPQLPNLNNYENMYIQYAEGLPGCVTDIDKGSIYVDIQKITDEGLDSNSIIIIMTDHGMGVGEKIGERAYGIFTYEYSIRTFAFFIQPRILGGVWEMEFTPYYL